MVIVSYNIASHHIGEGGGGEGRKGAKRMGVCRVEEVVTEACKYIVLCGVWSVQSVRCL